MDDPGNLAICIGLKITNVCLAVRCLKSSDSEEQGHHEEGSYKHSWSTSVLVEVENGGKGEGNVENILN